MRQGHPGERQVRGLAVDGPLPPGVGGTSRLGYLLDAVRLRPAGRAALSALSAALLAVGVGMFGYPLVTDLYGRLVQRPLLAQFDDPGLREACSRDLVAHGAALTKIRIPSIGVDVGRGRGHVAGGAAGRCGPLPRDAAARTGRQRRNRRPSDDVRQAVQPAGRGRAGGAHRARGPGAGPDLPGCAARTGRNLVVERGLLDHRRVGLVGRRAVPDRRAHAHAHDLPPEGIGPSAADPVGRARRGRRPPAWGAA